MEKPILFSGPMVRAILEGRKTQTRRVLKPQPSKPFNAIFHYPGEGWFTGDGLDGERYERLRVSCAVGDTLWVRETWAKSLHSNDGLPILFRADSDLLAHGNRWRPSIHMPRWASRITLRVTGVKVERLQDISEEDAKAEGIFQTEAGAWSAIEGYAPLAGQSPKGGFYCLWNSINGPGSWDRNDWVVAYSFERVLPK